jgi:hypothetical protein
MAMAALTLLLVTAGDSIAQHGPSTGQDIQNVISMRERV